MSNPEMRRNWAIIAETGYSEEQLADARPADYSLADIKWYSMALGLPHMLPDLCTRDIAPRTLAWLSRMAARAAVAALEEFRPK
ncbi:hypothetical protein M3P36_05825 [Altererythrobacter sp. KTW20L]|uniref:hypothetical protein n=1 Tax=Altererythrobacter sp. KTW20L TaxID=2942210 RepID=UPI0020C10C85|nr:hypothetical protein [Altererythrobacter sp. KTW20L]MCL6250561.1 hypothetical protein [Altererythrobacter sp. KTW20L]